MSRKFIALAGFVLAMAVPSTALAADDKPWSGPQARRPELEHPVVDPGRARQQAGWSGGGNATSTGGSYNDADCDGRRRRQRQLRCAGCKPGQRQPHAPSRPVRSTCGSINGGNTDSFGNNGGDVDNDNEVDVDVDNGNNAESGDAKGANGGLADAANRQPRGRQQVVRWGCAEPQRRPVRPTAGTAATVARRPRPVVPVERRPAAMLLRPTRRAVTAGPAVPAPAGPRRVARVVRAARAAAARLLA